MDTSDHTEINELQIELIKNRLHEATNGGKFIPHEVVMQEFERKLFIK